MTRNRMMLLAMAATALFALLLSACDDEPTQQEAEDQFCSDVGDFLAALGELRDIDEDSTVEEFEDARDLVRTTYDQMIESALELRGVRIDGIQEADEQLRAAVDDIDDDATLSEALDEIDDALDEFSVQMSKALNDVNCGSGQGGQESSDE